MNMIKELTGMKKELENLGKIVDVGNPLSNLIKNIKELEEKK